MSDNNYESKMTLYSMSTGHGSLYFDSKEQMEKYLKNNNITFCYKIKIDFMGNILNNIDVIKQTYDDNTYRYISVADEEGYLFYKFEQSEKEKKPIWGYLPGNLREIYEAFKSRGIKLEDDTYQRIDNNYRKETKKHIKRRLV